MERVSLAGREDAADVVRVRRRFLAGHEACAHPGRSGAERQDGSQATAVGDPAGRDDGRGSDGVNDYRHERQRRDLAPDVAAGFPALGNDDVDAGIDGAPRLRRVADRERRLRAGRVDGRQVRRRIAPEEGHDPDARIEDGSKPLLLRLLDDEVHPERPIREGARLGDGGLDLIGRHPAHRDHAQAAPVRDRGGQARVRESADRRLDDRGFQAEKSRDAGLDGHQVAGFGGSAPASRGASRSSSGGAPVASSAVPIGWSSRCSDAAA